jgi:ADP-dependent NAD(P)H-hydrate dehydratase
VTNATELTPETLRRMPLPWLAEGDKKSRGTVLIIGGSAELPGAALLAGLAALRAGAGRLRIATAARNAIAIGVAMPEALVLGLKETPDGGLDPREIEKVADLVNRAESVLIGPGLTDQNAIDELVLKILDGAHGGRTMVFDARAITSLAKAKLDSAGNRPALILTPHPGEMAGLVGAERDEIEAEQERFARETAMRMSVTIALKSAHTFVADPKGDLAQCRGIVGLATSGSGDVLAGAIAGLAARGADPFIATCWGVYLHAEAGRRLSKIVGPLGFIARELPLEITRIMGELS